jgi:carboxyl-terminal processing protease
LSISASRDGYRLRVMPGVVIESGATLAQDVELSQSDAGRGVESSGVGLVLGVNKKGILVILVLPYSAAARAGLAAGDQVLAIDGTSTEDIPLSDAIVRTMGPAGSSITLRVARGDEPPRDIVLTCEAMTL